MDKIKQIRKDVATIFARYGDQPTKLMDELEAMICYKLNLYPSDPNLKKVTKHTRATEDGKTIYCPHCNMPVMIYHFAWTGLDCTTCHRHVPKLEWMIR